MRREALVEYLIEGNVRSSELDELQPDAA
jgi:hypothetical protein